MTDLESPRKNNDCYFYYYSTCAKGDNCTFRHEPSALGCETMCSFWKEGKCLNVHCNFRHMELRKNRKVIPCYWESQPGGCLKPHCPFMHQSKADQERTEKADIKLEKSNTDRMVSDKCQSNDSFKSSGVDSLVVNFEEESDSETAPSNTPIKKPHVKTLEEIRLERVNAQCAAYYQYQESHADDLRQRILDRLGKKETTSIKRQLELEPETSPVKKIRKEDSSDFRIKTLAEIRAEKEMNKKTETETMPEVSSTSMDENFDEKIKENPPQRKIKLRRQVPAQITDKDEDMVTNSEEKEQRPVLEKSISNKSMEEVLLLEDDEDLGNVSMQAEDDLLNEIDHLLDD